MERNRKLMLAQSDLIELVVKCETTMVKMVIHAMRRTIKMD